MKKLKELKRNDLFTLKEIEHPTESQVYVKGEYDRSEKKYLCWKYSDINAWRYIKADKLVNVDFYF